MKHRGFFGDAEYDFALSDKMIAELEKKRGIGIGALYTRCAQMQFHLADLTETIRLGLIGGGTSPEQAAGLIETYADDRPVEELFPLAMNILDARWGMTPDTDENPKEAPQ